MAMQIFDKNFSSSGTLYTPNGSPLSFGYKQFKYFTIILKEALNYFPLCLCIRFLFLILIFEAKTHTPCRTAEVRKEGRKECSHDKKQEDFNACFTMS